MNLSDTINGYLDGKLTAEEVRELEYQLKQSAEARALYWEIAQTHALLNRHFDQENAVQIAEHFSPPEEKKNLIWNFAPFAAAAAIILGFFFFLKPPPPAPTLMQSGGFVARWSDDWRFLKACDLNLADGEQKELVFVNGVRVALEGPIDGKLVSPDLMMLANGRIGVHVPPGAEGFTVDTPAGQVVDFGTRFGIDIAGSKMRAEVFEGRIDVNVAGENYRMEGQASLEVVNQQASGIARGSNASAYPQPTAVFRTEHFGSFEELGSVALHHPTRPNQWAGDFSKIVSISDGVTPRSGEGMLQFLSTRQEEGSFDKIGSQVWRVVDLKPICEELGRCPDRVRLTAYCNRVKGDATSDSKFMFELAGQKGSQDEFHWSPDVVLRSQSELLTDANPATWEKVTVELQIPSKLRFLVVMVSAQENVQNQLSGMEAEFDGHFVDDVELEFSAALRGSSAQ